MNQYSVDVRISPRAGLLDPEGRAIHHALRALEFDEVEDVRAGRLLRLRLLADTPDEAKRAVDEMCRRLLANPVTEHYDIIVSGRS